MKLATELKRRNVFKVAVAYLVTAWLVAQVADVFLNNFGAPEWLVRSVLFLLILGFPCALLLARSQAGRSSQTCGRPVRRAGEQTQRQLMQR
jgi:cation transport ATPase